MDDSTFTNFQSSHTGLGHGKSSMTDHDSHDSAETSFGTSRKADFAGALDDDPSVPDRHDTESKLSSGPDRYESSNISTGTGGGETGSHCSDVADGSYDRNDTSDFV